MKGPRPIPTPWALRFRELRIRALPASVFVVGLVASYAIWQRHVAAPVLVGEVEARRAYVASVRPGTLIRLNVDRFAEVRMGDAVAEVLVCEPKYLESIIGVVKAECAVLRLQLDPIVNEERVRVDYERLRLNLLDHQVLLATAQIQFRFAQAEYERVRALRDNTNAFASQSDVEIALRDRDALEQDVTTRGREIAKIETALEHLRVSRPPERGGPLPEGWQIALEMQEQRLKQALAEFGPVTLEAPIDGTVSTVYRRSGENVTAGEPIVTITATRSDRILAYLMPPWQTEPKVGMAVEVRSRSGRRQSGIGQLVEVAGHLDVITSSLVTSVSPGPPNAPTLAAVPPTSPAGAMVAIGLPLAVSIPEGLFLLPGEPVDLRLLDNFP
jgi:hypothetical protein